MAQAGFIAETVPAQVLHVSGTTLFQIAMMQTGDPLQWVAIAELNGRTDPWIMAQSDILIPPVLPSGVQTGILDPSITTSTVMVPTAPITIVQQPSTQMLDFSVYGNSQYAPMV